MQQRTAKWMAARLGQITGSRLDDLLTKPRSKADKEAGLLSKTSHSYMRALAWETFSGVSQKTIITRAMQHGIDCEPTARRCYTAITGRAVQEVGFIQHPTERLVGCSPDGLVGDDGCIEIKCPVVGAIHLAYIEDGPLEHIAQIQGVIWVTGREWCDFISYHSDTPDLRKALHIVRIVRDQAYIDHLESAVRNFRDRLEETIKQLVSDQ